MTTRHLAIKKQQFKVISIGPDFCEVEGHIIPYDISRDLTAEKSNYSQETFAQGVPLLHVESVIQGVMGDMGAGIISGTSLQTGDVVLIEGHDNVLVEGSPVSRHLHQVLMNVKS